MIDLKRMRVPFYWVILTLLIILYFGIALNFFFTRDLNGGGSVALLLTGLTYAPLVLVLGWLRKKILAPLAKWHTLDLLHLIIPLMFTLACFLRQLWMGRILSIGVALMILFELTKIVYSKKIS